MAHRVPEGLSRLPAERPAGGVSDRPRDDHRQPLACIRRMIQQRLDCRLGIQRVEYRLDQEHVDPGRHRLRLCVIGRANLVEGNVPIAGIADFRRQRQRLVRRANGAQHTHRPAQPCLCLVRRLPGNPRPFRGNLVGQRLHPVIRHRYGGGAESIRLDEIGTGFDIFFMDGQDHIGPRQVQKVIVPLQGHGPSGKPLPTEVFFRQLAALDHGAHRTIQHKDASSGFCFEAFQSLFPVHGQAAFAGWGFRPSSRQVDSARLARFSV